MPVKDKILIVDDEEAVRFGIHDYLETNGFEVDEAADCRSALEAFRQAPPHLAIIDYSLPDGNALELLPQLRQINASIPAVVLTAHGSIDLAVRMIKEGAEQFLVKPVELSVLAVVLRRVLEDQRNRRRNLAQKSRQDRNIVDPFLGSSRIICQLAEEAKRVLATDSPILIRGETGSGKGVLARWLHRHGPRSEEAFVDLNCAGLAPEFLETELFGHEKGAFTGAVTSKQGLFEVAHRGTVFLDEIGDVDPQVQPKLLKVLEEKRFRRMGEVRDRQVDVRLVAATHRDLGQLAREQKFRSDLYFRVSTIPLSVPPLRDRVDDIPALAQHLLETLAANLKRGEVSLTPDAMRALQAYSWPGNVRELRNVLERALLLSERSVLDRQSLRFDASVALEPWSTPCNLTLDELERQYIERVLSEEHGHVDNAARRLGIHRSSLYQKIKTYGFATAKNRS